VNQETKDAWIQALESGEYVQGFGASLQNIGGITHHCAVGVLHWCINPQRLPTSLMEAIVRLNDDERWNFKEIAEWIRENVACDS
jgi:hypothetical protein